MPGELPPLYKRAANGNVQIWKVHVEPQDDGTAVVVRTYGKVGGKMTVAKDHVKEGKNTGKANATTPHSQALLEAHAAWQKQKDRRHYGEDAGGNESQAKRMAAPMLAHKYAEHADKVNWQRAFVQPKLDGFRCLIRRDDTGVRMVTRKGVEIVSLPHLAEQAAKILPKGVCVDGELYSHGMTLNKIGSFVNRAEPKAGCEALGFRAYDLVADAPYADRFTDLVSLMLTSGDLSIVRTVLVDSEADMLRRQAEFIEEGYEGAMLRWGELGYEAGDRSTALLKVKTFEDAEFKIVGVKEGEGTYVGMAKLVCVTDAGHPFEATAPGTLPQKRWFWEHREQLIGKKVTIQYAYMTATDKPVPFHAVAKIVHGVAVPE